MTRVVLGLVVVLVILVGGALLYFNALPTLSMPTSSNTSPSLVVRNAQLGNDGQLIMGFQNNGQVSTRTIQALEACSPDYSECQIVYAGTVTFVLPAGSKYIESLTIPPCGFAPNLQLCIPRGVGTGGPVPGQTYLFKVRLTLDNGNPIVLPFQAMTTGTYPSINPCSSLSQNDTITVTGVQSASLVVFGNLSGTMAVAFTTDRIPPSTVTMSLFNASVSASTGTASSCFNSAGYSAGGYSETLATKFSTVTTGITIGDYYLVDISIGNYGSYFFWVRAGSTG